MYKETLMKTISLNDMLEAGVHFGHQRFRRNPKMDSFIYTTRGGLSILDLEQTAQRLQEAFDYILETTSKGGSVLFLGTKKQAAASVQKLAAECDCPYINSRWLGGTFTNFETILQQLKKLRHIEEQKNTGELEKYTKRERLQIERDYDKMKKDFGGIAKLEKLPEAIFIVGVNSEKIAVNEARKKGIKIVAMIDTNGNPEEIDYPIPSNDDAAKAIDLIGGIIVEGVKEGKSRFQAKHGINAPAAPKPAQAAPKKGDNKQARAPKKRR
ncbi:30S ribosomal protein S2 [Patescibacteria group bacterium]